MAALAAAKNGIPLDIRASLPAPAGPVEGFIVPIADYHLFDEDQPGMR